MITYIKGELTEIYDNKIVVEAYGVGYEIMVPLSIMSELQRMGSQVKIYTYQYVKEDVLDLYGFTTRDGMDIFRLLITVNGIGPKGALNILSAMTPDDLRIAVLSDDVKKIKEAPGIGAKMAQKLIIELKDKMSLEDVINKGFSDTGTDVIATSGAFEETIEALVALGYSSSDALRAVKSVKNAGDIESEALLKAALKNLAFI